MYVLIVEKLMWVLLAIMGGSVVRIVLLSHKIAKKSSMSGSRLWSYIILNQKLDKEKEEVQRIAKKVKVLFLLFLSVLVFGYVLFALAPFFSLDIHIW